MKQRPNLRKKMPHEPFVPQKGRRNRLLALGAIAIVMIAIVVRGRGNGPISALVATKAATNGSFYHWQDFRGSRLSSEGWCAQRRSRSLDDTGLSRFSEVRESPSGIARRGPDGKWSFEPRDDVVGMEEGNDFLTKAVVRLTGLNARLTPSADGRWQGGRAIYVLEPRTARIRSIESPAERIEIDYPLAVSSDSFESPR